MRSPEEHYRQQGYQANKDLTHRITDNPYKVGYEQYKWWVEGWYKCDQEVKEGFTKAAFKLATEDKP